MTDKKQLEEKDLEEATGGQEYFWYRPENLTEITINGVTYYRSDSSLLWIDNLACPSCHKSTSLLIIQSGGKTLVNHCIMCGGDFDFA